MPFPASYCQFDRTVVGGLTGDGGLAPWARLRTKRVRQIGSATARADCGLLAYPSLELSSQVSIRFGKVVAQLGQTTSVETRRPLALVLLDRAAIDPRDSGKSPTMVSAPGHETQGAPFPTRQYRVRGPLSGQRPLQLLRFADPPGPGATTSIAHAEATPGKPRQSVRGRTVTRGQRLTEAGTLGSREMTLVRAQIAMQLRFRC